MGSAPWMIIWVGYTIQHLMFVFTLYMCSMCRQSLEYYLQ